MSSRTRHIVTTIKWIIIKPWEAMTSRLVAFGSGIWNLTAHVPCWPLLTSFCLITQILLRRLSLFSIPAGDVTNSHSFPNHAVNPVLLGFLRFYSPSDTGWIVPPCPSFSALESPIILPTRAVCTIDPSLSKTTAYGYRWWLICFFLVVSLPQKYNYWHFAQPQSAEIWVYQWKKFCSRLASRVEVRSTESKWSQASMRTSDT